MKTKEQIDKEFIEAFGEEQFKILEAINALDPISKEVAEFLEVPELPIVVEPIPEDSRIYYKEETNTKGKNKIKTRVEKVVINLEHFRDVVKKGKFDFLEEYDREVYIVDGKSIDNIKECKEFNRSSTPLEKIIDKIEELDKRKVTRKWHLFKENEHIFDIYKRYRITYYNQEVEYTDWTYKETITEHYNE